MDKWRKLVDQMENLAQHPDIRPEDIEDPRGKLAALPGKVQIVPETGKLVAEVRLQTLEVQSTTSGRALSIRMVAGA